jgi:hypothetical protein
VLQAGARLRISNSTPLLQLEQGSYELLDNKLFDLISARHMCIKGLRRCVFSYTSIICQRYRSYAPSKGLLTDDMLHVVYYWLPQAIEVRREDCL